MATLDSLKPMNSSAFEQLEKAMDRGGTAAVLSQLAEQLTEARKYHELFEALKMQVRYDLGLPLQYEDLADQRDEATRQKLEDGLLNACRRVGMLLLREGRIREGWTYLKPVDDKAAVAQTLAGIDVADDNIDQLIEVLLYEAVEPQRGFSLVLDHYGICNAITTFESQMYAMDPRTRQAAARQLVKHVHGELLANVKSHIARQEGSEPAEQMLGPLMQSRDWLTANGNYHIDTSHLASTVRFARLSDQSDVLELALDLTHYGRCLSPMFHYAGEEPFVDSYASHGMYFSALLGRETDAALAYFERRAEEVDVEEHGTAAIEVYIDLLARLDRFTEAIDASARLLSPKMRRLGIAPSLLELCQKSGDYKPLMHACRQHGDLLGFATGLLYRGPAAS